MTAEDYIVLAPVAALVALSLYIAIAKWIGVWHKWHYSNPFHRTCGCCGQSQIKFAYKMEDQGWWEIDREGEPWRHKHWADKFILRDLFWPHVLASSIKRFLKEEEESNEHPKNSK